jgi:transcription-repair coupling factor (superfamily II helicase)
MEIYRRLSRCTTEAELEQLEADLADAYGQPPPQAGDMLALAELRIRAARFGIRAINVVQPDLVFSIDDLGRAEPIFADAPGTVRVIDAETVNIRLPNRYFEPPTLMAVLRKLLGRAPAAVA